MNFLGQQRSSTFRFNELESERIGTLKLQPTIQIGLHVLPVVFVISVTLFVLSASLMLRPSYSGQDTQSLSPGVSTTQNQAIVKKPFISLHPFILELFPLFAKSFSEPFPATDGVGYDAPVDLNSMTSSIEVNSEFTIESHKNDIKYVFRLYSVNEHRRYATVYMDAGRKFIVPVAPGAYKATIASGSDWVNDDLFFGPTGTIYESNQYLKIEPGQTRPVFLQQEY